jgi:hypothetical protein
MHIITEEGIIYEGLALTPEEAKIYKELGEEQGLNDHTNGYISQSDSRKIAAYLCANFILTRRKALVQEPPCMPEAVPFSYPVVQAYAGDLNAAISG